jgi:ubiquinone/menaquinone biosynthesis C-methylase UbiE
VQQKGMMINLYDQIGEGYNITRQADPFIADRLYALLEPESQGRYLDIGCGTGNYTVALASKGVHFTGVEPAEAMLQVARGKPSTVEWLSGTAEKIPARNRQFDGAIATLTLHHWKSLEGGFSELARVMKESGVVVIFTATPEQMQNYWLTYYFPQMLQKSIVQMPSYEQMEKAWSGAGFAVTVTEKYFVRDDLQDLFLYAGKNKPELYLNEWVRKGISSFAHLSNQEEVKNGLDQLQKDINTQNFRTVKGRFETQLGDYLLVKLSKVCT